MKHNMKKLLFLLLAVLMMASISVTAFAATGDFTGDTLSKDDIKAYYNVVHEKDYADISGVKLSWSVPVVKYTKTDSLIWNTETLKWERTYPVSTADNEVIFTLTNRGSYAVKASVSFAPAVEGSASVTYGEKDPKDDSKTINTNDPTLATIVNADHTLKETDATKQAEYLTNNCTATIKGTVSIDNADQLTATSGKLGTYTVTISKPAE